MRSDLDSSKVPTKMDLKEIDLHYYATNRSRIPQLADHTSTLDLHPIPTNCCTTSSMITPIREKEIESTAQCATNNCTVINLAL
jgi:hypothetical protein